MLRVSKMTLTEALYHWMECAPVATWFDDKDHEVASTTAVGQFPDGNSTAGISDTSGNVWDWMNSWYDERRTYRTVRGSTWNGDRDIVRCALRGRYIPNHFDNIPAVAIAIGGSR